MRNGQYSITFAQNESIRIYNYNQDRLIVKPLTTPQNKRNAPKADQNSILVPPDFQAFKDCLDYHLNFRSTYTEANFEPNEKETRLSDPTNEILKGKIKCQTLNNTQGSLTNFSRMIPDHNEQCTWTWLPDPTKEWGGVFNVTLHKQPLRGMPLNNEFHKRKVVSQKKSVMMAITCTICIPHPLYCSISLRLPKTKRVTFAIPFTPTNLTQHEKLPLRTTLLIISMLATFFVVLGLASILAYHRYNRKTNKR